MKNDFRADLHCHSTCSDGTYNPIQLLEMAKLAGLKGISITDHDTISAYRDLEPFALEQGIYLLPALNFLLFLVRSQSIFLPMLF